MGSIGPVTARAYLAGNINGPRSVWMVGIDTTITSSELAKE
jgi:hypothetical protein